MPGSFQSTHPHGARRCTRGRLPDPRRRFNPRARTGRDVGGSGDWRGRAVSIHAPARGATILEIDFVNLVEFQSTRLHGARRRAAWKAAVLPTVSIHAPARGATEQGDLLGALACFNPRARTGRDQMFIKRFTGTSQFQSTRPHGARPGGTAEPGRSRGFNPRARTGRDAQCGSHTFQEDAFQSTRPHGARHVRDGDGPESPGVSIHAPARGATHLKPAQLAPAAVSIHAPARGATWRRAVYDDDDPLFQSTRPHGARLTAWNSATSATLFQSTRPHGARPIAQSNTSPSHVFQSTRPHGARRKTTA